MSILHSSTLAKPYVKALLHQSSDQLEILEKDLQQLSLLANDPKIAKLIAHPACSQSEVAQCLLKLNKVSEPSKRLLDVLARNKRLMLLPSIYIQLKESIQKNKGAASATIYSAYPLAVKQITHIHALLKKRYQKQFESSVEVDETLLGGVVIQYGNNRIDCSVRGFINQMYQSLCSSGDTL
jgi:F-type H+-transporting ATPase subunit delta